jgi:hypothetical protein
MALRPVVDEPRDSQSKAPPSTSVRIQVPNIFVAHYFQDLCLLDLSGWYRPDAMNIIS